jgi:mono/diheme cytochrome c family protein
MVVINQRVHLCIVVAVVALIVAATCVAQADEKPAVRQPVSYYEGIKPLLSIHCFKCHGPETQKSGLRLDVSQLALAGGKSGSPALVPGASARSEVVRRITSQDPDEQMPPKGARLAEREIEVIKRWIDEGANWPDQDEYWAFRRPRDPKVPEVKRPDGVQNPIDRFILSRLEEEKIAPMPPAGPRVLLRRAYADLLGLPPSPVEAERFLRDGSPDAYEKLIDRLLNDPRYGERWARHWLDLARYGESDGYEDDKIRPQAWRYRDYVIRSFNADKPYDRFVQEQIAGDELWPDDPDAWVATGFARLGAWDGMSKEPLKQRQDFLNDATDAVGAVFLGVTIGCARCHDHKYDLITQKDYYQIQAFFAGVKREGRDLKGDFADPIRVAAAYRSDSAELVRWQSERDELFRNGRQELEKALAQTGPEAKPKITDAEVVKKIESLHPGRLALLNAQIKALESRRRLNAPKAEVVLESGGRAPKTLILKGGELGRPGAEVEPGFIEAMTSPETNAPEGAAHLAGRPGGRRAGLARWLASPEHPLVARVAVNRLWQHHFGAGIVATPSDFGRNGRQPTHPELLDWLARQFIKEGFSLKKMHRLIMTSGAYRRSSCSDAAALSKDPENKLLWRMNRRRLEGEAIRDSILAVSGTLNPSMGGPGIYARLPQNVTIELPNNDKELSWGTASEEDNRRRSIYLFQRRSLTFPLMDVFDAPPLNQSCSVRAQTTVAPQALALFNGEFCREAAGHFAGRLRREAGGDPTNQIERAFALAFTRPPSEAERVSAMRFLKEQAARRSGEAGAAKSSALLDFCHAILNANELIYID